MLNEPEIHNEILDRLVDGELSDADYRQLLHRLEDCPEGWRLCALSFLEHQALQRDLRQMLGEGQRFDSADDLAPLDPEPPVASPIHLQDRFERWFRQPWIRWTSVLAVGVLAFVGGIALRPFGPAGVPQGESLANAPFRDGNAIPSPSSIADRSKRATDPNALYIENAGFDSSDPLHVPVLPIAHTENNKVPKFAPEQLPPQITSALGTTANLRTVERRVFFVRGEDGTVYIVPIDRIVPNSEYQ